MDKAKLAHTEAIYMHVHVCACSVLYLRATVRFKVCFHLQREFVDKGHTELGLGVGIGVPRLLVYFQSCFRSNASKPAWQVPADVVDLVGVLAGAIRTVSIGAVLNYLHTTAATLTLFTTLFLDKEYTV